MDNRLIEARDNLLHYEKQLKLLYPDLVSIGTPCYTLPPRISFMLKLTNGRHRCSLASRLILEATLGRRLSIDETCDHIDGNHCNDSPSNLQVLSRSDNASKGPALSVKTQAALKSADKRRGVPQQGKPGMYNGNAKLTDTQVDEIRSRVSPYVRGMDARLAAEYGVSRELVSGIRRGTLRPILAT